MKPIKKYKKIKKLVHKSIIFIKYLLTYLNSSFMFKMNHTYYLAYKLLLQIFDVSHFDEKLFQLLQQKFSLRTHLSLARNHVDDQRKEKNDFPLQTSKPRPLKLRTCVPSSVSLFSNVRCCTRAIHHLRDFWSLSP